MQTAISVAGLCKTYGTLRAVDQLNFSVAEGEVFGLLGANGAGKSTSIECILGTKRPDSGSVSVLGMNPVTDRKRLFQRVGVQFQEMSYQDRITVGELCEVTQSLYRAPADWRALLGQFGLSDKRKNAIGDLSGGERQRLFIVLALVPNPKLVFLDELTTGLDARARRDVWNYLKRMKQKGLAILITSHFMDEVETLCDRICILKSGATVFQGTVREAVEASPCGKFEDAYLWFTDEEDAKDESI